MMKKFMSAKTRKKKKNFKVSDKGENCSIGLLCVHADDSLP